MCTPFAAIDSVAICQTTEYYESYPLTNVDTEKNNLHYVSSQL